MCVGGGGGGGERGGGQGAGEAVEMMHFFLSDQDHDHVGHGTRIIWTKFCSLNPRTLYIKFSYNWSNGF